MFIVMSVIFFLFISIPSGGKDKKGSGAESSGAPLVFVPNGKESRMKDEEKLKTLKWNFASPRTEFIDQLKEQMQPCVSTALYSQLFHDDFKQHIAALGILTKVSLTNRTLHYLTCSIHSTLKDEPDTIVRVDIAQGCRVWQKPHQKLLSSTYSRIKEGIV